jgi:hypothetical protein
VQNRLHHASNSNGRSVRRCYLRLADNPRAKEALRSYLPQSLITSHLPFRTLAEKDPQVMSLLQQLRQTVGIEDHTAGIRIDVGDRRQSMGVPPPPAFNGLGSAQQGVGNAGGYTYHAAYRH